MPSEVSETEKDKLLDDITYTWKLKIQQRCDDNRKKADSQIQRTNYPWGEGRGEGRIGMGEWRVQAARCKVRLKDLLRNMGNKPIFYNNYAGSITLKIVTHYIIRL